MSILIYLWFYVCEYIYVYISLHWLGRESNYTIYVISLSVYFYLFQEYQLLNLTSDMYMEDEAAEDVTRYVCTEVDIHKCIYAFIIVYL
jgi:hypothetical protein